jgi:hypothetical protein
MDISTDAVDAAARALAGMANWCSCHTGPEPCADCRHEAWTALSAGAGAIVLAVLGGVHGVFSSLPCEHCSDHGPGVIDHLIEPFYEPQPGSDGTEPDAKPGSDTRA